jgi:predicted phage terminase large subunit-like protein
VDSPLDLSEYAVEDIEAALARCRDPELLDALQDLLVFRVERRADVYFPEARAQQAPPPGDWTTWLICAGRGWGKTRTGAEWIVDNALTEPGAYAIAGPTFGHTRDICIEGRGTDDTRPSGVITVLERRGYESDQYRWNRSLGELTLPNGSQLKLLSADEPDRARGWNFAGAWSDELASWRYRDSFDQLRLALRAGAHPRMIITTTPKPIPLVKEMVKWPDVAVTRGTTWENRDNLPQSALEDFERMYAGTRIGAQELEGEILDDLGLLFSRQWFTFTDHVEQWPIRARYWDLASTMPGHDNPDPDWTVGTLVASDPTRRAFPVADGTTVIGGRFQVQNVTRLRDTPGEVERHIIATARMDGPGVVQVIEQDPGQAGVSQIDHYKKALAGHLFRSWKPSGSKIVRAELASAAVQQGRVSVVRASWNAAWFDELEVFPSHDAHDDQVDSLSGAYAVLEGGSGGVASTTVPSRSLPGSRLGVR